MSDIIICSRWKTKRSAFFFEAENLTLSVLENPRNLFEWWRVSCQVGRLTNITFHILAKTSWYQVQSTTVISKQ